MCGRNNYTRITRISNILTPQINLCIAANSLGLNGLGDIGDKALIVSPVHEFQNASCIELFLQFHDTGSGSSRSSLNLFLHSGNPLTAQLLVEVAQDPLVPSSMFRPLQVPIPAGRHGIVVQAAVGDPQDVTIAIARVSISQIEACKIRDACSQCKSR